MKICTKCGIEKPLSAFYKKEKGKEAVYSRCKLCVKTSRTCKHDRQREYCKECGGSQICEHNRERNRCRECGGNQFCEHDKLRIKCKECGGSQICEHNINKKQCKLCGTFQSLIKGGFKTDEIKEIGNVVVCQFPGCLIQRGGISGKALCSDHIHDGQQINTENYRGEICRGHNLMLTDLDACPEWANLEAKEYMQRRPYSRKGEISC